MDVDKLIALLEREPILWDKSSEDYKNRDAVNLAWNRVAEEMGNGEMSPEEKRSTGKITHFFNICNIIFEFSKCEGGTCSKGKQVPE